MAHEAPLTSKPWWSRFTTLEPALVRAVVAALVGVAALWGLDAAGFGDKVSESWALLFPLIALLQGWWTRQSVTSNKVVVEQLDRTGNDVVAGPANTRVEPGEKVRSAA
jgi:hypothetical protein